MITAIVSNKAPTASCINVLHKHASSASGLQKELGTVCTYLIAIWLLECGEANGQKSLTATRQAAQTLMESCSSLADAPELGLLRSVHKVAHNGQQRAA